MAKTTKTKRKKIPKETWEEIEKEYVQGYISHGDLSKRYNIQRETIGMYAKRHNWNDKRSAYRNGIISIQNANKESQNEEINITEIKTKALKAISLHLQTPLKANELNQLSQAFKNIISIPDEDSKSKSNEYQDVEDDIQEKLLKLANTN